MTHTIQKSLLYIAGTAFALAVAYLLAGSPFYVGATEATVIPARIATTSQAAVTSTASTIIATSSCSSRIISTVASPIMLTFTDNQGAIPTGVFGHIQAASTTVVYDAGLYGCGAVKAYSFTAATITVAETR